GRQRVTDRFDRNAHEFANPKAVDPSQLAIARELEKAMDVALAELPPAQRVALHMKSVGYSPQEIAVTLSLNVNHVGVLIHRARKTVAQPLAPYLEHKG